MQDVLPQPLGDERRRPLEVRASAAGAVRVASEQVDQAAVEQPRLLDEARAAGALVQIVAPSLTGRWGREVGIAGWKLLDAGVVDLLGSDAHRPSDEATHLEVAAGQIVERYGGEVLADLTDRAPSRLVGIAA